MAASLEPAAALLGWASAAALPLWAEAGFDPEHGRFEERLTLKAERLPTVSLRLMSQARQIYAYAVAGKRGWHAGATRLVEQAYASMVRDFYRRDAHDGWIFSIRRDRSIADGRRDLYSHAFALLAIAAYVEATGMRKALALADETLGFIEGHMAAAQSGGFVEQLPVSAGVRRQNPHMHLFEALLALWECSGDDRYLVKADRVFALFGERFFRAERGVVGALTVAGQQPIRLAERAQEALARRRDTAPANVNAGELAGPHAERPRFVETLARRGYRFIAPVQKDTPAQLPEPVPTPAPAPVPVLISQPAQPVQAAQRALHPELEVPIPRRSLTSGLFALTQIMYLCFYVAALIRLHAVEDIADNFLPYWGAVTLTVAVLITDGVGIPLRLYLLTGTAFDHARMGEKIGIDDVFKPKIASHCCLKVTPRVTSRQLIRWSLKLKRTFGSLIWSLILVAS